jgi:CRP-like cAMP-binding protein
MSIIYEIAKNNSLFQKISFYDFETMINCLSARTVKFQKKAVILLDGDPVEEVGLVLSGSVQVIKEDENGRILLLSELKAADIFGETYACAGVSHSPVSIIAAENAEILFFDYRRIITICSNNCPFHTGLIENMVQLIAKNNLLLNQKIEILSKRTTREKLLFYFDLERGSAKNFTIPFSREELAHYLCVDRSAMSKELGKMRYEGMIRFSKNSFEIL